MKKDKATRQKFRQASNDLYDAWEEIKDFAEGAQERHNVFAAAVKTRFNEINTAHVARAEKLQDLCTRIERRRLNIDARLRGKKLPFPKEKGTTGEILREARKTIEELSASDTDAEEIFTAAEEEAEEAEFSKEDEEPEEEIPDAELLDEPGEDDEPLPELRAVGGGDEVA